MAENEKLPFHIAEDTPADNAVKVTISLVLNYIKRERAEKGSGEGFLSVLREDFKNDPKLLPLVQEYAHVLKHCIETHTLDPYQFLMVYDDEAGERLLSTTADFIGKIGKSLLPEPGSGRGRTKGAGNKPKGLEL